MSIMYKNKYLKYKQKYNNLLGGSAAIPKATHEETIDLEKCKFTNYTITPIREVKPDTTNFIETLKIIENIKIEDYTHLIIIIGGKCQKYGKECYEIRSLNEIIEEAKLGKKTLVLVIDNFDGDDEPYNPELVSLPINENIHIQHLNIGISTNKECLINIYLNRLITNIKGLVIIINAVVFLGSSSFGKQLDSINGSYEFLTSIFEESNLKKKNVIPYTYITNKSNFTDRYNFIIYFRDLNNFTINFGYSILETLINILKLEFKDLTLETSMRLIFNYFLQTTMEINNIIFLNYLINQKLKK
jgi:hypothetical protein